MVAAGEVQGLLEGLRQDIPKSTVSASRAIDVIRTWINQGVGIHLSTSSSLPVAR
jgi:hypothetical protein